MQWPAFHFWINPTTITATLTIIGSIFVAWNGAKQTENLHDSKQKAELEKAADTEFKTELLSETKRQQSTEEKRRHRERLAKISELLILYAQLPTNKIMPSEFGQTWWPVDWINSQLEAAGEDFIVVQTIGALAPVVITPSRLLPSPHSQSE